MEWVGRGCTFGDGLVCQVVQSHHQYEIIEVIQKQEKILEIVEVDTLKLRYMMSFLREEGGGVLLL